MKLQRYDIVAGPVEAEPFGGGKWCREDEVEALEARCEELEAENAKLKTPAEPVLKETWGKLLENLNGLPTELRVKILGNVHNLRAQERESQWETMPDGMTYPPWEMRRKFEKAKADNARLREQLKIAEEWRPPLAEVQRLGNLSYVRAKLIAETVRASLSKALAESGAD